MNIGACTCLQLCEMPWRKMLTSGPVWAVIVGNFCSDWGLNIYEINIPTFYYEVLFFDMESVTTVIFAPLNSYLK